MSFQSQKKPYALWLLKYKNECIQIVRAALSRPDSCITDQTIALALVLAAEEVCPLVSISDLLRSVTNEATRMQFMTGNMVEYRLHSGGIIKMVNIRGGIKNLGNGFLEHLLSTSVYNPRLKMVDGPVKCHRKE
jgi:hypothetical protein